MAAARRRACSSRALPAEWSPLFCCARWPLLHWSWSAWLCTIGSWRSPLSFARVIVQLPSFSQPVCFSVSRAVAARLRPHTARSKPQLRRARNPHLMRLKLLHAPHLLRRTAKRAAARWLVTSVMVQFTARNTVVQTAPSQRVASAPPRAARLRSKVRFAVQSEPFVVQICSPAFVPFVRAEPQCPTLRSSSAWRNLPSNSSGRASR